MDITKNYEEATAEIIKYMDYVDGDDKAKLALINSFVYTVLA